MDNQKDSKKLEEQLMLLKMMTQKTGVIHEAQALQLKMWPRLLHGVESSTAKVDPEEKKVVFQLSGNLRTTAKSKKMFQAIDSWTKLLLWDNTIVIFKKGNKVLYNSEEQNV